GARPFTTQTGTLTLTGTRLVSVLEMNPINVKVSALIPNHGGGTGIIHFQIRSRGKSSQSGKEFVFFPARRLEIPTDPDRLTERPGGEHISVCIHSDLDGTQSESQNLRIPPTQTGIKK